MDPTISKEGTPRSDAPRRREMVLQHVGRLPVVDNSGAVVGVVTLSSLALRSAKREETLDGAGSRASLEKAADWGLGDRVREIA